MLEDILDTKVKVKIAKLFSEEKAPMHVSHVARKLEISKSRASECMRALEENGLLTSRNVGKSVLYKSSSTKLANAVFATLKQEEKLIIDIENKLKKEIIKLSPVSIARYGSSLNGLKPGSDVDFILLFKCKPDEDKLYEISAKLSEDSGIRISIFWMTVREFKEKAKKGEEFVLKVTATNKLLYGKNLEELIW
ncbi:MAG: helix-turn-helix transcriptional regulator, partial [Candidatus Aenigmarchaeota archaeon]|nr:helix-turn-helix transcriptional regulator [Candidatus Aenigmarchaeota archaeon]MCK5333218.1 helix-turn-helix transcriptional regulator [Candidatus Aenigmarchaeota archaeon]